MSADVHKSQHLEGNETITVQPGPQGLMGKSYSLHQW